MKAALPQDAFPEADSATMVPPCEEVLCLKGEFVYDASSTQMIPSDCSELNNLLVGLCVIVPAFKSPD